MDSLNGESVGWMTKDQMGKGNSMEMVAAQIPSRHQECQHVTVGSTGVSEIRCCDPPTLAPDVTSVRW